MPANRPILQRCLLLIDWQGAHQVPEVKKALELGGDNNSFRLLPSFCPTCPPFGGLLSTRLFTVL